MKLGTFILGIAFTFIGAAAITIIGFVAHFVTKGIAPELHGKEEVVRWCDAHYDESVNGTASKGATKRCEVRWSAHERFELECLRARKAVNDRREMLEKVAETTQDINKMREMLLSAEGNVGSYRSALDASLSDASKLCSYSTTDEGRRRCELAREEVAEDESRLAEAKDKTARINAAIDNATAILAEVSEKREEAMKEIDVLYGTAEIVRQPEWAECYRPEYALEPWVKHRK